MSLAHRPAPAVTMSAAGGVHGGQAHRRFGRGQRKGR
jgi:hypothetical protein